MIAKALGIPIGIFTVSSLASPGPHAAGLLAPDFTHTV